MPEIVLKYRCNGPRDKNGKRPEKPCGVNLTPLMNKIPEDGQDYFVVCPKCGNKVSVMRTPPDGDQDGSGNPDENPD